MTTGPEPSWLPLSSAAELAKPHVRQWPRYVIGAGLVAYGTMVVVAFGTGSFKLIEPVPLVAVLAFFAHRLALKVAERDRDPTMVQFVMAAFSAKMVGTLVRALVVSVIYHDRSDSIDYHQWGQFLAPQFRSFDFSNVKSLSGTEFLRALTGVIYTFTGASEVSGALVMSFLSFLGLFLLWRAFRRAVPNGLTYRYGLLVLFLPSLLYWPSALGKEGWAIFCLGVGAYGVARVLTGSIPLGGVLFGAALLVSLTEGLRALHELREFVYGGLIIVMMIFRPRGLIDEALVHRVRGWLRGRTVARSAEVR